jgi:hypothetical protein
MRAAAVAVLSCSLVAPGVLTLAGAAASGAAAPRRGAYVDQYHVPGGQIHSLAVDRRGGDHWLAAGRAYYTRMPGDHKAKRAIQRFSKSFGPSHPLLRSVVSAVNGKSIDVVSANCSTLQVVRVPATTRVLPKITPADTIRTSSCGSNDYVGFTGLGGVTALAHNRVALLYPTDPEHPNGHQSAVYVGRAGHTFTRRVLPDSDEIESDVSAIARDAVNGSLYVAELDNSGLRVWYARTSHHNFRAPVRVSSSRQLQVESIAASHHQVWIALEAIRGASRGVYLVHRTAGGKWSTVRRVPGTHRAVRDILLAASPASKHTSVWEANGILKEGVAHGNEIRHLTSSGISSAHPFTDSRYASMEDLATTWHGGVHIGYEIG